MAEMSEAVKARLREIQAARRAAKTAPGRGTLRGCDPIGWMGSLDAIANSEQCAEDARTELLNAKILTEYPDGMSAPPKSRHRVKAFAYTGGEQGEEVRVRPRQVLSVHERGRGPGVLAYRWARLWGITKDREAMMAATLGGRAVEVEMYRGPERGTVREQVRFYPADQIAVLCRLVWFGRYEDRGVPEFWKFFREAFQKYVILYTDGWARVNDLDETKCPRCDGATVVPRPHFQDGKDVCSACKGNGKVPYPTE